MPGTFTLHDEDHSRRVAERMVDLAGEEVIAAVDPFDLGVLLLSAFLHDIGMTPKESQLDGLLAYLLSADSEALPKKEREALQMWLDDSAYGIVPPLSEGAPSTAVIREARSLVAGYVRARHNEWSVAWMKGNLAGIDQETYSGFLLDLVLLCKSHHFGYDKLRGGDFEPRLVGTPGTVLNLRFDACLLRVADVLDFDPERTPKILYDHRDVEATSAIFWHKDHNFAFVQQGNSLRIHARPPDAFTHHAIDITVADVDRELQLCRRLAEEMPLDRMGDLELPHKWELETNVRANIKPRDGVYEYMDGTFRPDQERILELLGGIALYGSPLAAVRELLQNAFDAVRERIAYQRLRDDEPAAQATLEKIAATHRVSLTLEQTDEGMRLVCRDSGVGMSRDIIRSRFLVGGSTASHETRALERECEDLGFSVGRTARFGIGVLAYFLLGSRLKVETRRCLEGEDSPEEVGWTFLSDGLNDFGELRRNPDCMVGTEIELLIKAEAMSEGPEKFAEELAKYVREVVRRVPCHFSFTARGADVEPFECEPGWIERKLEVEDVFLQMMSHFEQEFERTDMKLFSSERRREYDLKRKRWAELRAQAQALLTVSSEEENLPDGLGSYRVFLGHFAVDDEVLLFYMDLDEDGDGKPVAQSLEPGIGLEMGAGVKTSWNGMSVEYERSSEVNQEIGRFLRSGIYIEIDWTSDSAGELAVDRGKVKLSSMAREAIAYAGERASNLQRKLVRNNEGSRFSLFNAHVADVATPKAVNAVWPGPDARQSVEPAKLSPLEFPAVDLRRFELEDMSDLRWREQRAWAVPQVEAGYVGMGWAWHDRHFTPRYLGARRTRGRLKPVLVWTGIEVREAPMNGFTVEFPPEWADLISVLDNSQPGPSIKAWNIAHPIVDSVDTASWEWASQTFSKSLDPLPHAGELMKSRGRVASWVLKCVEAGEEVLWAGLKDRAPSLLGEAWDLLGLTENYKVYDLAEEYGQVRIHEISSDCWRNDETSGKDSLFVKVMKEPGGDWWLTTPDGNRDLPLAQGGSSSLY